ncbi:hypothetical protein ACLMJK_003559 [Lecanora helva]
MVTLSEAPPALMSGHLTLYYSKDALLDNLPVLVFYGPSTTSNVTHNSSRIQSHIYSLAGFRSFPRLTIAPSSPLYAAVNHLPADQQGDEVSRGLAVSLLNYFASLSKEIKTTLRDRVAARRPNRLAPMMFDEMHAGDLAANMEFVENYTDIANLLMPALAKRVLSWVDMNIVMPVGTIQRVHASNGQEVVPQVDDAGLPLYDYGKYSSIVESFGLPAFLPTSKLQRAPSRPTAHSKNRALSKEQKISLRRELCELVDTENSYVAKVNELVNTVAPDFRQHDNSRAVDALFPRSLWSIREINEGFCDEIQTIISDTENEAIRDIEGDSHNGDDLGSPVTQGRRRDPTGITHVAKAFLRWFPKFTDSYQEYLRASAEFPQITRALEETSPKTAVYLQEYGEQRLRSALIEPVQRLPRYSLLIDNLVRLLPASHVGLSSLLKARDIVTDICTLDGQAATDISRSTRIWRDLIDDWPTSLAPKGRFITAVDMVELEPPYVVKDQTSTGLLLLFADVVVVVRKKGQASLSARGVLAEIDRSTTSANISSVSRIDSDRSLLFLEAFDLFDLHFSESEDGSIIQMCILGETAAILSSTSTTARHSIKVYNLLGPYDGKAARFTEDVVKARTESRFPEAVRDGGKWALRSISPLDESIGILAALSEENPDYSISSGYRVCDVHLAIDQPRHNESAFSQGQNTCIAAHITSIANRGAEMYHLEVTSRDGTRFAENCSPESLVATLVNRSKWAE